MVLLGAPGLWRCQLAGRTGCMLGMWTAAQHGAHVHHATRLTCLLHTRPTHPVAPRGHFLQSAATWGRAWTLR